MLLTLWRLLSSALRAEVAQQFSCFEPISTGQLSSWEKKSPKRRFPRTDAAYLTQMVSLLPHVGQLHMWVLHCVWASPVRKVAQHLSRVQLRTVHSSCSSLLVSLFSWEPSEQGVSCMSDGGSSSIDPLTQEPYGPAMPHLISLSICVQVRCQEIRRHCWTSLSHLQPVPFASDLWQAGHQERLAGLG